MGEPKRQKTRNPPPLVGVVKLMECVNEAIEANANVNHETVKHVTALNLACEDEHEDCALQLLRAGAHADVQDDWGDTPRSIAEKKGMSNVLALMQ